ncbi:BON domain-containing protein [Foetidibacter luteolus]|uniref:BON domain-containing protein n=1 Tax=Foetidibacter luteolus TaxID=2608880 RepID=UPI00129A3D97|nr:BON domain-containing protein [Foetidibacter luteolus]
MKTKSLRLLLCALLLTASVSFLTSCKSGPKDTDLTATLQQKLSTIPGVSVAVKDGVATLSGEVKDEAAKATAESEAKAVEGVKSVVNSLTVAPPPPPPVVISPDDALIKSVTDAIKDFSGVKADVKEGVVTLTGEIKRTSLPKLIMAVQALKPKKVENKLTIK